MPNASVIETITLSGHNHIDALLDKGPDWNYQNPGGNVISYTFSISSGNEPGESGQVAFSASQQAYTRAAMNYVAAITGIVFSETANGEAANIHFCNTDIQDTSTTGLCAWYGDASVVISTNELVSYRGEAYIYLDNREFGTQNANLAPGGSGYETLLHEIGHMLGLKHPFETMLENGATLPYSEDSSQYTLMSYYEQGGPYSTFSPYDIAALNWIYGGDGLGGALGIGSTTGARYLTGSARADFLTGTAGNDKLRGEGGNDSLDGGDGEDTAIFSGASTSYSFSSLSDGAFRVQGLDGTDILRSVEIFQFSNGSFRRADLADTTAPTAPTVSVPKNTAGYIDGNAPFLSGVAEAGSTIKVFSGTNLLGSVGADSQGFWKMQAGGLANGNYSVTATATDASNNVSASSTPFSFKVDALAPSAPTASTTLAAGANQPLFNGSGEAGTTIYLVEAGNSVLGKTVVDATGKWSIASAPVADGAYSLTVQSVDLADNSTSAASKLVFSVASALNRAGTAGNDTLTGSAGNNALSGFGGLDTAVYSGARADYIVLESVNGYTVSARTGSDGMDSLIGVERIKFADTHVALDVDGVGGQVFRLYKAAYDRAPDLAGIGYWMAVMDQGASFADVARDFLDQNEFLSLYGANSSNTTFVSKLYQHVLHRPLDQAGADFWLASLSSGESRGDVLRGFSESAENIAQVVGSIQNGFEYALYTG